MFKCFLLAVDILVDESMELWGVVHVGEVGEFVADDIFNKLFGQKQ